MRGEPDRRPAKVDSWRFVRLDRFGRDEVGRFCLIFGHLCSDLSLAPMLVGISPIADVGV